MKKNLLLALLLAATPAFAHAHLKFSAPAADARVKAPKQITLKFSEAIEPAFSGAVLVDSAGKPVPMSSGVNGSGITMIAPGLMPGTYRVEWHSVGQDTHRMTGSFAFTVVP